MSNRLLVPRKTPGLLDLVPGAAAAYSLRSLSNSYADPVVTVRRSSDDAEADFTAAEVADGTLAAFAGAGDAFVKQWWDQSGNARHAVAAADANEPQIVDSGVVVTEEGKPALQFDGSDDYLTPNAYLASGQLQISLFAVVNVTGTSNETVISEYTNAGARPFLLRQNNASDFLVIVEDSSTSVIVPVISSDAGKQKQLALIYSNGEVKYCENGAVLYQSATLTGTLATSNDPFTIGTRSSLVEFAAANVQEVVLYQFDLTEQREVVEGNIAWGWSV